MSLPDRSIDPKILDCAKEEFMEKGFTDASLRSICSKAGVTTGALYKRFSGKDALFEALLESTMDAIETLVSQTEKYDYEQLHKNQMQSVWNMSAATLKGFIELFYEHYDGFRLLLCHAEGSAYSDFLNGFVSEHTKRTLNFAEVAYQKGISSVHLEEDEIHMMLTAFWSILFEPIKHELPKEKALRYCNTVAKLFNWQAVFGF